MKSLVASYLFLLPAWAVAQDTVRVMSYNLLAYSNGARDQQFRTVIHAARPDLLITQEFDSINAVPGFLHNVLNTGDKGDFQVGILIDGPDSDNAVFYRASKFSFVSTTPIRTALRHINEFVVRHNETGMPLRIFAVHLNAGISDSSDRAAEVDSLRKVTDKLQPETDFIVAGDFNIYGSYESAYRKLITVNTGTQGHVLDPVSSSGTWNDPSHAPFHTQSTRVRAFGGGATGGLDDRFDMILLSQAVGEPGGITLIQGSYRPFGNDGFHYNDSINRMPNAAVSEEIAMALHEASDHLPVLAELVFDRTVGVREYFNSAVTHPSLFVYPNPFNPTVTMELHLETKGNVRVEVYDLLGRRLGVLLDGEAEGGTHRLRWEARGMPAGIYFAVLRTGMNLAVQKLLLLK